MSDHNRFQPMAMSSHMSRSQELNYVEGLPFIVYNFIFNANDLLRDRRSALKTHQMARLGHIQNETTKLQLYLETLRKEVQRLEALKRRNDDSEWAQKVSKLREENRSLRIECHCLSMEVDLYASGQVPLGVTDENFYRNVRPGPNGLLNTSSALSQAFAAVNRPYPVQQMPRPMQPPSYEESIYYPPPRFVPNTSSSSDILRQVPPPPRPVWLPAVSPSVQQSVSPLAVHTNLVPPQLPPRPNSASPRTPVAGPSRPPLHPTVPNPVANPMPDEGQRWTCEKCTVENHPALAYCEVCEMPRNGYLGICLNATNFYVNPVQNVQTVAPHVLTTDCYCHNCRQ